MIKNVDKETARAFAALRNSATHKLLAEDLSQVKDTLIDMNDATTVRQLQGAGRKLRDILSLIEGNASATTGNRR